MPTAELMSSEDLADDANLIGSLDEEMAQLLESAGDRRLMAGTSTCTSTCTCTASQYSSSPCCC